jgi:hypothetical protein
VITTIATDTVNEGGDEFTATIQTDFILLKGWRADQFLMLSPALLETRPNKKAARSVPGGL